MIHVIVGTRHLQEMLGYGRCNPALDRVFYPALRRILSRPLKSVSDETELAELTVSDILETFHEQVCDELCEHAPKVLDARRKDIQRVARELYNYPDFECSFEDTRRSLAVHQTFPHGSLSPGRDLVYLPDCSVSPRHVAFAARASTAALSRLSCGIDVEFWCRYDGYLCDLSDLECHLCDTLYDVYRVAIEVWNRLRCETSTVRSNLRSFLIK